MTKARKMRLKEARKWYPEQHFTGDSHIVKAYRKRFNVDKDCAMRELCMLGMLPTEKQKSYQEQLDAKARKRAEKREARKAARDAMTHETDMFRDENFYYIAGYTSGGAPYGITWEEARRDGLLEEEESE